MNNDSNWLNLFVPGRLCLFGEHSDWAGSYDRPASPPGYCIAVGTNQGIYARICQRDKVLIARSHLPNVPPICISINPTKLLLEASNGGFWSYVAGTLYAIIQSYPIAGLEIDCYQMDLPIKKGLSSSAAICVLVARACNQLYHLGLSTQQEMELAYWGETLTPSRCGRLDQVCAFGQIPMFLTFEGQDISAEPIALGGSFYYLIVDLQGTKDTVKILRDLNAEFATGESAIAPGVRLALGTLNQEIVFQARQALTAGDSKQLGELMVQAQQVFDRLVAPACPSELQAPKLHRLLEYPPLQELIWGGKGVGSQGDGTAQLLTRSPEERLRAKSIIENDLGLPCLNLTLSNG